MATIQINASFATYMRNGAPTQDHPGDGATMVVGAAAEIQRGGCKIPFTGIPTGSIFNSVTMDLYLDTVGGTNRTLYVYRCKQAQAYDGFSWNEYDNGSAWQTAGAAGANDRESTESGSKAFTTGSATGQYHSVTLTVADIEAMYLGSYTNNGFILKMDTESADAYQFQGHAGANPPRFTIDYTPPPDASVIFF